MNWRHALRRKFTHRRYSTTKTNFRCVNVSGFQSGTCLGQLVDQTSMFFHFCRLWQTMLLRLFLAFDFEGSFGLLNSQHVHPCIFLILWTQLENEVHFCKLAFGRLFAEGTGGFCFCQGGAALVVRRRPRGTDSSDAMWTSQQCRCKYRYKQKYKYRYQQRNKYRNNYSYKHRDTNTDTSEAQSTEK